MPIQRHLEVRAIQLAKKFPIITVTGPRQAGKTTLCKAAFASLRYYSLEAPDIAQYARSDPRGFLAECSGGAILDEIQRVPQLLSYLQEEVDARPRPGRFVLTGSANLSLLAGISQSLAGRTGLLNLYPCSLEEVRLFPGAGGELFETLARGSYPAIFDRALAPGDWYSSYVGTYLERDVRQLLNVGDLLTFQTFLKLCAGRTGQLVNLADLASDCGISHNTARAWLSVLEASFLTTRLAPWAANRSKRLVKTPKLHWLDTGLVCYLLGIRSGEELRHHPLRGAIFETWVISEILKHHAHRAEVPTVSFYRDRDGVEVDLILERGSEILALEIKSGQTLPEDAFDNLRRFSRKLPAGHRLLPLVVYGGATSQDRSQGRVVAWDAISSILDSGLDRGGP